MTLTLTRRDLDLLDVLTLRVRLLTIPMAARLWWPGGRNVRLARRRLEQLAQSGFIEFHGFNAHPLLPVTAPIFAWRPGIDDPDCERIAAHCRARWVQPARLTAVCVATPLAANLFGSTARGVPPREHRDHDLRLACVYAAYRQQQPRLATLWTGEHGLPKAGYRIKDPDAFLCAADGRVLRIIESAGRYNAKQVQSFHDHCEANELAYELW